MYGVAELVEGEGGTLVFKLFRGRRGYFGFAEGMFFFELLGDGGITGIAGAQREECGGSLFDMSLVDVPEAVAKTSGFLLIFGLKGRMLVFA